MDFAVLMERSRKKQWALVILDLGVDTTTPSGEMIANVMATFAQFERRLIGQRTKDALAAKRRAGVQLGRPPTLSDDVIVRLWVLRDSGLSYREIADIATAEGWPTGHGAKRWHGNTVRAALLARKARPT
jgi:DNA invertase Pin-like site-specific DNA recombinase